VSRASLYAQRQAAHLEQTSDCRVPAPPDLAERFRRPTVCPEPIFFKQGLVGRRPFWKERAGIKLGRDGVIYLQHVHGHPGVRREVITTHDLIWARSKMRLTGGTP
jgi:hypothetical protein